jgi:hypothetical protein
MQVEFGLAQPVGDSWLRIVVFFSSQEHSKLFKQEFLFLNITFPALLIIIDKKHRLFLVAESRTQGLMPAKQMLYH